MHATHTGTNTTRFFRERDRRQRGRDTAPCPGEADVAEAVASPQFADAWGRRRGDGLALAVNKIEAEGAGKLGSLVSKLSSLEGFSLFGLLHT